MGSRTGPSAAEQLEACDGRSSWPRTTRSGGDVVSGGGTGTYDLHTRVTEVQAGSYVLMDTAYAKLGLPFAPGADRRWPRSCRCRTGWAVCDAGLKSLGMDHGDPTHREAPRCGSAPTSTSPSTRRTHRRPLAVGDRVRRAARPRRPDHGHARAASYVVHGDEVRRRLADRPPRLVTARLLAKSGPSTPDGRTASRQGPEGPAAVGDGVLLRRPSSRRTCGRRRRSGTKTGS